MRLVFALGLAGLILSGCGPEETPEQMTARICSPEGGSMAAVRVRDSVRDLLKSPSTAEFYVGDYIATYDDRNCSFLVTGPVHAQNSFGAMVSTTYVARIQYLPADESWNVISASLLE